VCGKCSSKSTVDLIYTSFIEKLQTREGFGKELISAVETNLKLGKLSSLDAVAAILGAEEGPEE